VSADPTGGPGDSDQGCHQARGKKSGRAGTVHPPLFTTTALS
jgi:hypothetical protein